MSDSWWRRTYIHRCLINIHYDPSLCSISISWSSLLLCSFSDRCPISSSLSESCPKTSFSWTTVLTSMLPLYIHIMSYSLRSTSSIFPYPTTHHMLLSKHHQMSYLQSHYSFSWYLWLFPRTMLWCWYWSMFWWWLGLTLYY